MRQFGQWITAESWEGINVDDEPSEQVKKFEGLLTQKLDEYLPKKTTKLGIEDKPFMTSELKSLKRRRMREYRKKGKSEKYVELKQEYDEKYEKASENFLRKNVDSLKESNPGRAYSILKKMGAMPGECEDTSSFTLPSHENLPPHEAAEKIAEHFSLISREFPPLSTEMLPERVTKKLIDPESESKVPEILTHEVHKMIMSANKPKSGVPGDLPRRIVTEFGPELSTPICKIFKSIAKSSKQGISKWPASWKQEFGIPLQKIPDPQTEDDLRIISLTAFFSKVMEKFVISWLMFHVGDKLDPKQFGGQKGNSISHYIIELINFILYNQDYNLPIGILACAVDFSKAFNRQNHNILVTKLSDMGVPGWLLNIVMGFLTNREMVVRYSGVTSQTKPLPGGGPQGTLLGLLLFLILINDCGVMTDPLGIGETITNPKKRFIPSSSHAKYVDDLTIVEAMNLKKTMVPNPDRPLPDTYHARLGLKLPKDKSKVYEQLQKIQEYASDNEMKLNCKKSKFMLFNPTQNFDFVPEFEIEGNLVETQEEMKILGIIISNTLSWRSNTDNMCKKAYSRLWMIKRLKQAGANLEDMKDVYIKQIRSLLEFGVPVWNSGLKKEEILDIERVQRAFLHIVLGQEYHSYELARIKINMETLEERRTQLCTKFAVKTAKHPKHKHWFVPSDPDAPDTRSDKTKFKTPLCRLNRFKTSPIPYLTGLLNSS